MNQELSGATDGEEHDKSPVWAGRGREPLFFPGERSNSCWRCSWGLQEAREESALPCLRETSPRSCDNSAPAQLRSQMCPLGMAIPDQGEWENRQKRPPALSWRQAEG